MTFVRRKQGQYLTSTCVGPIWRKKIILQSFAYSDGWTVSCDIIVTLLLFWLADKGHMSLLLFWLIGQGHCTWLFFCLVGQGHVSSRNLMFQDQWVCSTLTSRLMWLKLYVPVSLFHHKCDNYLQQLICVWTRKLQSKYPNLGQPS
jgi:hypothetical protein